MSSSRLANGKDCVLVVVDVQEKFRPAIEGFDDVVAGVRKLALGAKVLDLPILYTEQYPQGLGRTVSELTSVLEGLPVEKTSFGCFGDDKFRDSIECTSRNILLLCGIETHVCIYQTAMQALDRGFGVYVVEDAVSSRKLLDKETALKRMHSEGVRIVSVEMLLFELLGLAGTQEFKKIQQLVR